MTLIDELLPRRFVQISSKHTHGTVTERDKEPPIRVRPPQDLTHRRRERDFIQSAMTSRDK